GNNLAESPSGDASADVADGTCNSELESILCGATEDVQEFWQREFKARGETYEVTQTVFYSSSTDTGCGAASSSTGPFYCPADHLVYFDLDFLVQLQDQFDAEGDLAAAYIVAHEYGHHVQNVLGISARAQDLQQQQPDRANEFSVALELQADCFAGVWASDARSRNQFENDTEIDEALNAAAAVGDDRIQQKTQGRVDPETFTHGTSEQRMTWFKRGYTTADRNQCDTFAEL
ncbi:MAG: neutral zinc metallopeptidase, partial [Ilumatobacteraceae bacterium]